MRCGLQNKLFLIVMAIATIPLVLLSAMGYYTTRQTLTQAATQNLAALARLQLLQLDSFLHEKKQLMNALSGEQSQLSSLLAASMHALGKKSSQLQRLRALLLQKQQNSKFIGLGVMDAKGRLLAHVGASLSKQPPILPSHKKGVQILGVVHFSKASETILRLATPIQHMTNPPLFLVADFPFSLHQRFLQEKQAPAFQGEIYLLNENGGVLCGSLDINRMHHLFGSQKKIPFLTSKNPKGTVHRYTHQKLGLVFGIALHLREASWTLFIELPEATIVKPLHRLRTKGLFLIVGFIFFLGVAIGFVARRTVRPLQQLLLTTNKFKKGEFDATLPIASADEIGELTQAFGEMGKELHSYYTELEVKVAERTHELEEAQRFSDLLFHTIPEVILVTDRELRVIKANRQAQELFGEEVLGSFCFHIFEGEGATCEGCLAHEVIVTGEPRSMEDQIPHPQNGELFYKDFYPICDHKGEVIGVLESAKIITHQKQLMAQVIQQEKIAAVGLMASGVAHEIGNPLASIFAIVQRLQKQSKNSQFQREYKELEERCLLITRILETLSDYARKKPDRSVPLDLKKEIEKAIALVRFDRRLREVQVTFDLSANLPLLWGQEDALSQVMTNLLLNALDAVQDVPDGQIEIKAWPNHEGILLQVTDNGHGIEQGEESKLFEPFFTTKERAKGTGLGLSVCKQIIESLGGQIQARSGTQRGALFEVSLPSQSMLSSS